jgi:hypothetical protein
MIIPAEEIEKVIVTLLKEKFPSLDLRPGTPYYDLFVSASAYLISHYLSMFNQTVEMSFLSNYATMPEDLMNKYAANFFVTRQASTKARGLVRIYFAEPISIYISYLNEFVSNTGLSFYPIESQAISKEEMSSYYDANKRLYYVPIILEAFEEGDQYNIPADSIVEIRNFPYPYVEISNDPFTGGTKKITNEEFYQQIIDALNTREFITKPAIVSRIKNVFSVRNVIPASFKDEVIVRSVYANSADIYVDKLDYDTGKLVYQGTTQIPVDAFEYKGNYVMELTIDFSNPDFKLEKDDGTIISQKIIYDVDRIEGFSKGMPFGYGTFGAYRFGYGELYSPFYGLYYDIVTDPKERNTVDEKITIAIPAVASGPFTIHLKNYSATQIQSYVDENAPVNLDMKVRLMQVAKVKLTIKIKGKINVDTLKQLISDYLESIPPGGIVEADDIMTIINENFKNVTVYFPFEQFSAEIQTLDGKKYYIEGESTLEIPRKIENKLYSMVTVFKLDSLTVVSP